MARVLESDWELVGKPDQPQYIVPSDDDSDAEQLADAILKTPLSISCKPIIEVPIIIFKHTKRYIFWKILEGICTHYSGTFWKVPMTLQGLTSAVVIAKIMFDCYKLSKNLRQH